MGHKDYTNRMKGASNNLAGVMEFIDFYKAVGGDYNEVMRRLQSDAIIRKYVLRFPSDPSYDELGKARKANDIEAAFLSAHSLKGLAATLGFYQLAAAAAALTEALRPRTAFPAEKLFVAVDSAYAQVVKQIAAISR